MELFWCWRCEQVMPFLNEEEYGALEDLYGRCFRECKKKIEDTLNAAPVSIDECFEPFRSLYKELTGHDCHHNAVLHHRLRDFGPPCPTCGKPFRTPESKSCVEAGCPPTEALDE